MSQPKPGGCAGFEHVSDGYELDPAGAADEVISYYRDVA